MEIEIAIITPNTLEANGLKQLIKEATDDNNLIIRCFKDFGALTDDTPDMYKWYFVSAQIYALYNNFFNKRKESCVILIHGLMNNTVPNGTHILNIFENERKLRTILGLFFAGNYKLNMPKAEDCDLSIREIEVLSLVAQGYLNKEIADKLNISSTTVITHRKNITKKLGIKTVSGLTMYAVMNGYVEADNI